MSGMFKNTKFDIAIPHRNWQRALTEAFCILSCASPGEVVCIVGPSRAGKSLLICRLIQMLFGECRYEETGQLLAVVVDASNTGPHGTFSTKAFTQRMLNAVKHPLFSTKGQDLDDNLAMQKMDRTTEATLRIALEQALIARGTQVLFIDEAQHVKYVSKDAQAAYSVMDSWKCLAQAARLVIVFVGAYPILDVISNSPHLVGRKHQIHFPRYRANEEDILAFGQLLQKYSELIELDSSLESLVDIAELMHEGSLGCVGLLKAWVKRADAIAVVHGTPVNEKLLRDTRLPDIDVNSIRKEIITGEHSLSVTSGSEKVNATKRSDAEPVPPKKSGKSFQKKPTREASGNRTKGK